MLIKLINRKSVILLALFAFCFSSGPLGDFLLHKHEIHLDNNHVHVHLHHVDHKHDVDHNGHNADHGLGGGDHHDVENIVFLDFMTTNQIRSTKPYSDNNKFLSFRLSSTYPSCYLKNISRITHSSNANKFLSTNLYQLNSSFLI